jgi:hypothetical protein
MPEKNRPADGPSDPNNLPRDESQIDQGKKNKQNPDKSSGGGKQANPNNG